MIIKIAAPYGVILYVVVSIYFFIKYSSKYNPEFNFKNLIIVAHISMLWMAVFMGLLDLLRLV